MNDLGERQRLATQQQRRQRPYPFGTTSLFLGSARLLPESEMDNRDPRIAPKQPSGSWVPSQSPPLREDLHRSNGIQERVGGGSFSFTVPLSSYFQQSSGSAYKYQPPTIMARAPFPLHQRQQSQPLLQPLYPPDYMDSSASTAVHDDPGPSPATSNASATIVNAAPPARKKHGRGPGKKDIKDKPTVSVRWDDGDLTERLIAAVEQNERWQGVFAQNTNEPGQLRAAAPVAKRDLQREIARNLFQSDPRYDLNDRKVLESLAVSVKNKLFKLTTLFTECKQELGQFSAFKDEREIPPNSELASTWARVKDKFPQYLRIRDLMSRVPSAGVDDSSLSPVIDRSSTSPTTVRPRNHSLPLTMSGQVPQSTSSSLKGAVTDAQYMEASSGMSASYMGPSATTTTSNITSPTYPMHSPRTQQAYPQQQPQQRRMTGGMPIPNNRSNAMPMIHQPQPQQYVASPPRISGPASYGHPSMSMSGASDTPTQSQLNMGVIPPVEKTASPDGSISGNPPSPPLSQTIQHIVTTLTERKDRERARAHEIELMRLKREEAERARWHQREMMRLKIQLIRAERSGAAMASSTPGAGPSHLGAGNVEDDLALAAGLGDDGMSLEGDGEGELDEDMFGTADPAPTGTMSSHGHHPHHRPGGQ